MSKVVLTNFDMSKYLETKEDIKEFITEALETGDQAVIANAFGVAAKAVGMSSFAKSTGLSREQLYKSFSENGNPTLKTMIAALSFFNLTPSSKSV